MTNPAEQRKAQEELINALAGGYYKTLIEMEKAYFDEYIRVGFTREESLKLVMNFTRGAIERG